MEKKIIDFTPGEKLKRLLYTAAISTRTLV